MSSPMVRFCLTLSLIIPSAVFAEDTTPWGDWFNPPRSIGPTLDYSTNPVYVIGDTTQLDWTTVYRNYSIALWQQNPGGGWATLGPVIYQTFEPSNHIYNWSVSPLQFNLSVSNIFFLWLYPGPSTQQGSDAPKDQPAISTHYFNITQVKKPVVTGTITSTTAKRPTSTSLASAPESTSVSLPTTSLAGAATLTQTPNPTAVAPHTKSTSQPSTGLNPAAFAGVGKGVALLSLTGIAAGFLWHRRRQKRKLQPKVQPQVPGYLELPGWRDPRAVVPIKQRCPAEAAGWRSPVELEDTVRSGRFGSCGRHPVSPRELPAW